MNNRIIVCGSRNFSNKTLMFSHLETITRSLENIEIISGGCRGADNLAEEYANIKGYELKVFPADWNKYGRAAGPIRNKQMLDYALEENAIVVAFWDCVSRGTVNMIRTAEKAHAKVHVIYYDPLS